MESLQSASHTRLRSRSPSIWVWRIRQPHKVTLCTGLPEVGRFPRHCGGLRLCQRPRNATATTATAAAVVAETAVAAVQARIPAAVYLSFTPVHALLGGLVLGLAVAGKLLTTGRILGISGAIRGLVSNDLAPWRFAFLGGMAAGSLALTVLLPQAFEMMRASCPLWRAAISGLLVGLGTSLGNGCTSGHGICGLARLSARSLAYTLTFMAAGAAVATASRAARCAGIAPVVPPLQLPSAVEWRLAAGLIDGTVAAFVALAAVARVTAPAGAGGSTAAGVPTPAARPAFELASEFVAGMAFALGLGFSGMAHPTKVVAFLSPLYPAWDLSLPLVMAGAVVVALVAFQGVIRFQTPPRPLFLTRFQLPSSNAIDARLLLGGLLFGAGWGMSGLCPGPALLNAIVHQDPHVYTYLATMLAGMALETRFMTGRLEAAPKKA